jgi:hypothetical protein
MVLQYIIIFRDIVCGLTMPTNNFVVDHLSDHAISLCCRWYLHIRNYCNNKMVTSILWIERLGRDTFINLMK